MVNYKVFTLDGFYTKIEPMGTLDKIEIFIKHNLAEVSYLGLVQIGCSRWPKTRPGFFTIATNFKNI